MAHRYNSEEGARARRVRAGYASVRSHIALGRVPGEIAREAVMANARRRRLQKALDAAGADERINSGESQLSQLRRIAAQENAQLAGDLDPSASVILDDTLEGI